MKNKNILNRAKRIFDDFEIRLDNMWLLESDDIYDVTAAAYEASPVYQILRTTAGVGVLETIKGEVFTLTENTLFIAEYRNIKRFFCKEAPWCFQSYGFDMKGMPISTLNQVHSIPMTERERRLNEDCFAYLGSASKYEALYAQHLFESLFSLWHISAQNNSSVIKTNIESALSYVMRNLSVPIKVSDIAANWGVSEVHLRRMFHQYVGMSPKQYMEEKRLVAAKDFLLATTNSLKEISEQCGFANQHYFSRCFKKRYGISPTKLRIQQRK